MPTPVLQLESSPIKLALGEIKGYAQPYYLVLADSSLRRAVRSAGCLLEPEIGDRILILITNLEAAYILHVLERGHQKAPARLSVESPELQLLAPSMAITARDSIAFTASQVNLEAVRGHAKFGEFSFFGGLLIAQAGRIKLLARFLETTAERMLERLKRSYRQVEHFEEKRIGRWRVLVEDIFHLSSRDTTLKAEDQVKIDAEKIHLG